MKNIIQKSITAIVLNSAICGIAYAENPEEFSMVNFSNLAVEDVNLKIFDRGNSISCVDDTFRGAPLLEEDLGTGNQNSNIAFSMLNNDEFCIELNSKSNQTKTPFYYGPFIANDACRIHFEVTTFDDTVYTATEACINPEAYTASFRNVGKDRVASKAYEVRILEAQNSYACQNNTSGEMYSVFYIQPEGAYQSEGEYIRHTKIKNYLLGNTGQVSANFCVEIKAGTLVGYFGPYNPAAMKQNDCQLHIKDHSEMDLYCPAETTKVYMNVKNRADKEYKIKLYEYNAAFGDCKNNNSNNEQYEEPIEEFYIGRHQFNENINMTTITNNQTQFCMRVTSGSKHGYYGPYDKKNSCTIEVRSTEDVTLPGNEICLENRVSMNFHNKSENEHEISIHEIHPGTPLICAEPDPDNSGTEINHVTLHPRTDDHFPIDVYSIDQPFCLTVTRGKDSKHYGPYNKKDKCTIQFSSTTEITSPGSEICSSTLSGSENRN